MLRCRWLLVMETTPEQGERWSIHRLEVVPLDVPGEPSSIVVHTVDELVEALLVQWNESMQGSIIGPDDLPAS